MNKRTQQLQFDKETIEHIQQRDDYSCYFCKLNYEKFGIVPPAKLEYLTHDIAHFIPKSKGGLGIAENGVEICRHHHHELDNGGNGQRERMLVAIEKYLKSLYPKWNKERLYYKK